MNNKGAKMKAILVTTEFRGVFFGYLKSKTDDQSPEKITLKNARNCISWASSIGGFLGLASKGPDSNCRIGTKVDELTLYKITSITPVNDEAATKWNNA